MTRFLAKLSLHAFIAIVLLIISCHIQHITMGMVHMWTFAKNQRFILPVIGVLSNLLYLVMWKSIEDLTALKRNHFFVTSVPSYSFKAVPFNTHKNLMVEGSICEMSAYEV